MTLAQAITAAAWFAVCLPLGAQATGWLDPAWARRAAITIDNPAGTPLSNFQVHLVLNGSFNFAFAKPDGSDIRLTQDDGITLIPFWIERWDRSTASASVWVNVPSIPRAGAAVYLYCGNPGAPSASNGNATFEFFDDFASVSTSLAGYYPLVNPSTSLVRSESWETSAPHTLSVVPVTDGGYNYRGYYGLEANCGAIGLAYSNDLINWVKSGRNPIAVNGRWPVVMRAGGIFYMIYTKDFCATSYNVLAASTDGINFKDVKVLVPPQAGLRNQGAWLFQNPVDGLYYLYWYRGDDTTTWHIMARSSPTIEGLDRVTTEVTVLSSNATLAATSVIHYDGTYFMATEARDTFGNWITNVYASTTSPVSGFHSLADSPILGDGSACLFQYLSEAVLHGYYCRVTSAAGWILEHRSADLNRRSQSFDAGKWTRSAGAWQVVTDIRHDGTSGSVLQGVSLASSQVLLSRYSGTDYVLEAYGKQIQGREWGLGVRVNDPADLYSAHLYDDLNGVNNLYAYRWVNRGGTPVAAVIGSANAGQVTPNTWYKMTIAAHANQFDVYKDGILAFVALDTQYPAGGVALFIEPNSITEWSNVVVRKYAAFDPIVTIGPIGERTRPPRN